MRRNGRCEGDPRPRSEERGRPSAIEEAALTTAAEDHRQLPAGDRHEQRDRRDVRPAADRRPQQGRHDRGTGDTADDPKPQLQTPDGGVDQRRRADGERLGNEERIADPTGDDRSGGGTDRDVDEVVGTEPRAAGQGAHRREADEHDEGKR